MIESDATLPPALVVQQPKLSPAGFCFKNRRFGGVDPQEGLEVAPDILAQNFLEISARTIRARPSRREPGWAAQQKHRIFLEN
jgi:hypothetical protein